MRLPSWPQHDSAAWEVVEWMTVREHQPPGFKRERVRIYLCRWRGQNKVYRVLGSFVDLRERWPMVFADGLGSLATARDRAEDYLGIFAIILDGEVVVDIGPNGVVPMSGGIVPLLGAWRVYSER